MFNKNNILNEIENKKQEDIMNYDKKIEIIKNMDDYVEIYSMLAEVYHNSVKQAEIGIEFLKEELPINFVSNFKVKRNPNYIDFYNDEYSILFPTSLCREIIIKDKKSIKIPYKPADINSTDVLYLFLLENYMLNPTLKNKKMLIDIYLSHRSKVNIIGRIIILMQKKYTKDDLEKARSRIFNAENAIKRYNDDLKKYNERNQKSLEFVNSLNFLNDFENKKYRISLVGINNHDKYNTKSDWSL